MIVPFKFSVGAGLTETHDPFDTADNELLNADVTKARLEVRDFAVGGVQARVLNLFVSTDAAAVVEFGVRGADGSTFRPRWSSESP